MAHTFFKKPTKMLWIFKTKFIRDFTYRFIGVEYLFLRKVDKLVLSTSTQLHSNVPKKAYFRDSHKST